MLRLYIFYYIPSAYPLYLSTMSYNLLASALKKPSSHQCSGPALSAKTLPLNLATSQPVIGLIIHHLKLVNTFFKKFSFFSRKKISHCFYCVILLCKNSLSASSCIFKFFLKAPLRSKYNLKNQTKSKS